MIRIGFAILALLLSGCIDNISNIIKPDNTVNSLVVNDDRYNFATLDRIIDGDTLNVKINIDSNFEFTHGNVFPDMEVENGVLVLYERIRLLDIDTYELRGSTDKEKVLAIEAKDLLESLTESKKFLVIVNKKTRGVNQGRVIRDGFGRILAEVWVQDVESGFWINVAYILLKEGLAEPYED